MAGGIALSKKYEKSQVNYLFIGSIDKNGKPLWIHSMEELNAEDVKGICVDSGKNILLTGTVEKEKFKRNFFTVKVKKD